MSTIFLLLEFLGFFLIVFGLGLPWVAGGDWEFEEAIALAAGIGTGILYLYAWMIYWLGLPNQAFVGLLLLAAGGCFWRRRTVLNLVRQVEARRLLGSQLLFSGWCVAWVCLVSFYSGGEWYGDWYEHYQRAVFFLDRLPFDQKLLNLYILPARPPLANLVDVALMAIAGGDFSSFQLFNTLFSTLVFLPAVLLLRQFGGRGLASAAALLVMLLANPMVIQNATFAWTKLLAAFFVLLSLVFYLRGLAEERSSRRLVAVLAMAAAVVTHYSAGPYALVLAGAQLGRTLGRRGNPEAWRELAGQAIAATAVLATWFGWSLLHYGAAGTFLSNTTATGDAQTAMSSWPRTRLWNAYVTLIPHPFRTAELEAIAQTSRWGYLRDYWFNIYQTTLPGGLGFAGGWLMVSLWFRKSARASVFSKTQRRFWWAWIGSAGFFGIAAASWEDRWGVAHLCLIPLILVGITWLAARFSDLPNWVRRFWWVALVADGMLGIVLHFNIQHWSDIPPTAVSAHLRGQITELSYASMRNLMIKVSYHLTFLADAGYGWVFFAPLLAGLFFLAARPLVSRRPS